MDIDARYEDYVQLAADFYHRAKDASTSDYQEYIRYSAKAEALAEVLKIPYADVIDDIATIQVSSTVRRV